MPRLNNGDMDSHALPTGSYGYSAARLEDLGAAEYTLVSLVVDVSASVSEFKPEMEDCIKEVINACRLSPRADNLMLRLVTFNSQMEEIHGFKLLEECNPDDYNNVLKPRGVTALFDASENAISASSAYGKDLTDNDFAVNGIVIILTDGGDNDSSLPANSVGKALSEITRKETMESMVSILVGVGTKRYPEVSKLLDDFQKEANFTQFVELENASSNTLAKLAEFVSKSISAQSQSLGTGGPSTPLSLNI